MTLKKEMRLIVWQKMITFARRSMAKVFMYIDKISIGTN